VLIIWGAWAIGRRDGLLWVVPLVLSINYFLLIHTKWNVVDEVEDRPLEGHDGWQLTKELHDLCVRAEVRPPKVVIIRSSTPQAYLLGRHRFFTKLYVTQGFLDRLNDEERRAILAFEVAALKMHHPFNFVILGAFFDRAFWIISGIDRSIAWVLGTRKTWARSMTLWAVWPMLYLVQRFCLSPKDYFRLDRMAADLCDDRNALCQALWKLESSSLTQPLNAHPAWSHVFAVGPWEPRGPLRYLQPQPSAKKRIQRLNGGYPI
jgi:Zn-dependent protease with chaperone function